ncbi:I78 family peptidase inhibitor [Sphingomonas rubra]|uniref:Peptidase inhibitor I78 family protein n=1 Tax=Sphingomonas rubra TaxID=634430 RepID=A0A1I5PZV1_9SPHN|nr:I78 family peptidase inhibitor [Sphingomonas rubra]SFP39231.1 Peptidase inhibitor I78 family protein [Sphingomonas rubra]
MKHVVIVALALGACAQTPALEPLPTGPCRVDLALRMRWVGQEFKLSMRDDIQREANARTARVLRPDDAATMDLREDRLNIRLSEDGKINSLDCG